jgi:transcriptional regulator with XRE-family HTH domain
MSSIKSPDDNDIAIGRLIRAQRLVCRMSQTELANKVGVTFQQVQKYEKGVNRVGAGRLCRIAEALNVPVTFFFEGAREQNTLPGDVNEALSFLKTAGAIRLLRAYDKMDSDVRGHLLAIVEIVAGVR